jgi:hypothetical protein
MVGEDMPGHREKRIFQGTGGDSRVGNGPAYDFKLLKMEGPSKIFAHYEHSSRYIYQYYLIVSYHLTYHIMLQM